MVLISACAGRCRARGPYRLELCLGLKAPSCQCCDVLVLSGVI